MKEGVLKGITIGKISNVLLSHKMSLFFADLVPGSDTYLYQETLYQSESCKRRLRRTAPCGPPGMATQVRPACRRRYLTCIPPSPAGPPSSCPLHLLYLLNLKFVIGIPNRCCILELRTNQCFVCNFLSMPRCHGYIAPKKTHCLSCLA